MSPRRKVFAFVAAAAAAAACIVVAGTLLASRGDDRAAPAPAQRVGKPRKGFPPLVLDLGVRSDAEAAALRRAGLLYRRGEHGSAGRIFARSRSLNAKVGAAFAAWNHGGLARLEQLSRAHPRSGLVQLHLGLARFWAGHNAEAVAAWRAAARRDPDTASAVVAGDFLHPNVAPGLPTFLPSFQAPRSLARLPRARQLAELVRNARNGGVRATLLYGVALQQLGHAVSAEREYATAAARAPRDPDAQVAAAVGRFDKERPERAFSRLGPLVRRFPRTPTVRYHLGLLLVWIGQVDTARKELRRAYAEGPSSIPGREAKRLLTRLEAVRTN